MKLRDIANTIKNDWTKPYFGAIPYLQAMSSLDTIDDAYGDDDGRGIVIYFLANAQTWKGEVARETKKLLNKMLKS